MSVPICALLETRESMLFPGTSYAMVLQLARALQIVRSATLPNCNGRFAKQAN
jgi:hypothetical protein